MTKRDISADFFEDSAINRLPCDTYRVVVYLLHGPHLRHLPITKVDTWGLAGKYRISEERWAEMVEELKTVGITFEHGYCVIDSPYLEHGISKSSRNDSAIQAEINRLPVALKSRLLTISDIDEKLGRSLADFVSLEAPLNAPARGTESSPDAPGGDAPEQVTEKVDRRNPDIQTIVDYAKDALGLDRLDGGDKNRQFAKHLLTTQGGVEEAKQVIDFASQDEWRKEHHPYTSLQEIYRDAEKLKAKSKVKPVSHDIPEFEALDFGTVDERSYR